MQYSKLSLYAKALLAGIVHGVVVQIITSDSSNSSDSLISPSSMSDVSVFEEREEHVEFVFFVWFLGKSNSNIKGIWYYFNKYEYSFNEPLYFIYGVSKR